MTRCKECPLFRNGMCRLGNFDIEEDCVCSYELLKLIRLTEHEAEVVLHYAQKWRRGETIKMISPYLFGKAIDTAIRTLRKTKYNETHHSAESRR